MMSTTLTRFLVALTALCALVLLPASGAWAQDGLPDAKPLDRWQYTPDPADAGGGAGWQNAGATPDDRWHDVTLPHLFEARPVASDFGGTVGWYRTTIDPAVLPPGFAWAVRFEQVRRSAAIWLNGQRVGTHLDPYVPFTVPLDGLEPGQPASLVVRVDNRKGKEPREGWWNWGGITRPAELVPLGRAVLHDPGLMSRVACEPGQACSAKVLVDGEVENRSSEPLTPRVAVSLTAPGASQASEGAMTVRVLEPGERARVRFEVPIEGSPDLWSPDAPNLYDATVTTTAGDEVQQVDHKRIGLRSVRVRGGVLLLNGKPLDALGTSIQEDLPGRGPALTDADIDRIVAELKAVHATITRAHYLLNERLLDKLDEAGIMVWSQAPIYHRDRLLETPEQRAAALETVRGTVLAARNHASVITHSVANELSAIPDAVPGTAEFLRRSAALERDLDPTLPVSVDLLSYPGYGRQATFAQNFDLLGVNSYFGWYPGKPNRSTARLGDLGPYLRSMRVKYPRQALMLTEFGAESTFKGPANVKETFAFQSDYLRRTLGIYDSMPFMSGAIYWTLREFAVKPKWDGGAKRDVPRDGIHNKGLLTYAGARKPAWQVAEKAFASASAYRGPTEAAAIAGLRVRDRGMQDDLLVWGVATLILVLLAVDVWALRAILRPPGGTAGGVGSGPLAEDAFRARRSRVARAA
jgi:beta-glucuronidase